MIEEEQEKPQIEEDDEFTRKRTIAMIQVTKRMRLMQKLMYNPRRPFISLNLSMKKMLNTMTAVNTILGEVPRLIEKDKAEIAMTRYSGQRDIGSGHNF
jgi:hypothetical protein